MGGDCLNFGCVPSKALIAAAHGRAGTAQRRRLRHRAGRAQGRFRQGDGSRGRRDRRHRAQRFGRALREARRARPEGRGALHRPHRTAGRQPSHPQQAHRARDRLAADAAADPGPRRGAATLTNETIFANRTLPVASGRASAAARSASRWRRPIRRLGARVTVLEAATCLAKDDPELAAIVDRAPARRRRRAARQDVKIARVERHGRRNRRRPRGRRAHRGLAPAGRRPAARPTSRTSISTRPASPSPGTASRSTTRCAPPTATSGRSATATASMPSRTWRATRPRCSSAARCSARRRSSTPAIVPWATYTDPELAQVGLSEARARASSMATAIRVLRWKLAENDRAQAERETDGLVKVVTDSRGRILGAAIVGPHAGELIQPWCLALSKRLKISAMASFVPPYPTLGESEQARGRQLLHRNAVRPARTRCARCGFLSRLPGPAHGLESTADATPADVPDPPGTAPRGGAADLRPVVAHSGARRDRGDDRRGR